MNMNEPLKWTGERLTTEVKGDTAMEHLARYAFALDFVKDKVVLDAACGEGYGTNLLASQALFVIGVDSDKICIEYASRNYQKDNLKFVQSNVEQLSIASNSIDVVISFETIEHIYEHEIFLKEVKRVLRKDGMLIISTPDKQNYSDKTGFKNPFHKKELYANDFLSLLEKYFLHIELLGQTNIYGSSIHKLKEPSLNLRLITGNFTKLKEGTHFNTPLYLIAVASDNVLTNCNPIMFYDLQLSEKIKGIEANIMSSWTYKIGLIFTLPIRKFRNFIQKKLNKLLPVK
jgi:2-polyprenyl-3-methyl-5-hydroxy-6-metoxy-1,4-benzoquinol methylase